MKLVTYCKWVTKSDPGWRVGTAEAPQLLDAIVAAR
jgi:hypothetical protein